MANVFFHYLQVKKGLNNTTKIKKIVINIFDEQGVTIDRVDYIFCLDKHLLNINRKFLCHDYYTDIITFSLEEKDSPIKGEIYISIERVKENAKIFDVSIKEELLRVVFHGALHLCSFNDTTAGQKKRMKEKEAFYLKQYKCFT
ncbi:MAG: rRNA maturation RNase YbeY [Ginsengibacter sp.]